MPATDFKTWEELADVLGYGDKTLRRWRRKYLDCPRSKNLEAWRLWLERHADAEESDPADDTPLPGECEYDDAVTAGRITYSDAEKRERVVAERIKNDELRGSLVTKDEAKKACAHVRDVLLRRFERTLNNVTSRLSAIPVDLLAKIAAAIEAAWAEESGRDE